MPASGRRWGFALDDKNNRWEIRQVRQLAKLELPLQTLSTDGQKVVMDGLMRERFVDFEVRLAYGGELGEPIRCRGFHETCTGSQN